MARKDQNPGLDRSFLVIGVAKLVNEGSSIPTQIRSFRPFLFVALFQGGGSEERAHDRATHLDPSLNAFQKVPAKSQWSSRLIL